MRSSTTYNREKLYEEVWAKPMLEVCKEYGVSDVALAKMCRKLRVPVPGRGHWAKIEAGQTLRRPPLPKLKANERSQIVVSRRVVDRPDEAAIEGHPDVTEKVRLFLQKARAVEVVDVPQRIVHPHRLLVEDERRREKSDWKTFRIDAGDALFARAKRLLQGLAVELEQLGAKVQPSAEPHMGIFDVVVGDTKVAVRLRETLRQERTKETGLMASFRDTRVDLVPSGQMELTIEGWLEGLPRRRWKDSEDHPLEDVLPAVIVAASGSRWR